MHILAGLFVFELVAAQDPCTALGGWCGVDSNCDTEHSHRITGICPKSSDTCCVQYACHIPDKGDNVFVGMCRTSTSCTGKTAVGLCPGSSAIRCCSTAATSVKDPSVAPIATTNLTPRGRRLLLQSDGWKALQLQKPYIDTYPKKNQCANNVSKVLEMAGFNPAYLSIGVKNMIDKIKRSIPDASRSRDYLTVPPRKNDTAFYAEEFNKVYGGYIPIGTVVGGCLNPDCSGESGFGHMSFVCKVSHAVVENGKLVKANFHLCHSNWLRYVENPGRELIDGLGTVGQYMVNQTMFLAGVIERQWMSTPWLQLQWKDDKVSNVTALLPELDDLDPNQYTLHIMVLPEISAQLKPTDRIFKNSE